MDVRTELSSFLKARRGYLRPEDVGLIAFGERRRVPGLRREEVARLAGVSIAHYTRLEQGHGQHVSSEVLDAVAGALRLDADEREHLANLVRPARVRRSGEVEVAPRLLHLLDALGETPAYITGPVGRILAWNRLASALFLDFGELPWERRTWSHVLFEEERIRALVEPWEEMAAGHLAVLRLRMSRTPDDTDLTAHIAEMSASSGTFLRMWNAQRVSDSPFDDYVFHHAAGDLTLTFQPLAPPRAPELRVGIWTAEPGSPSATMLRSLTS